MAMNAARWICIVSGNRLLPTCWSDALGRWTNPGIGGSTFGGADFATPILESAGKVRALASVVWP